MEMVKSVEEYLDNNTEQKPLLEKLRGIILKTELQETVKWGIPTYQINKKNVVGIGCFKSYSGMWFFNGSFLSDPEKVLINAQDGKTKGMRQWRFGKLEEIDEKQILPYLHEAIQNQKDGKEIKPEKKPLIIPDELKEVLASDSTLSEIFDEMNLTLKREYAEYISDAKREDTKLKRLEKIVPMIKEGIGLNDKYR